MQAALDCANSGLKVYLVEKEASIGGVMPQLDKTFPTNDCAMCMLAPKLVDTGRHPNIQVITLAQVEAIEGEAGHFRVRVKKMPRYVDEEKCNGCGECAEKCPVEVLNDYDEGLAKRKAIYKRFAQANPNIYAIDKRDRPPCRLNCPAGTNVQGYVALISKGKFQEALELIKERLPFPGVLGRICHHPCERKCNRNELDEALAIRELKRFVADWAMQSSVLSPQSSEKLPSASSQSPEKGPETGAKVAIVGSGPAGLTAAHDLAKMGYPVTVFEALPIPGGMLRVGIPAYRLPKDVLDREIQAILDNGVEIRTNFKVGRDITLSGLKEKGYKAIFLAIGATCSRTLKIEGIDSHGVLLGVDFLRDINLGRNISLGRRVIVIGGGNVAIDVARSALRIGPEDVHVVCLEAREEMPAHRWEIEEAEEEGIVFHRRKGPKRVIQNQGKVRGLETIDVASVFDSEGRFNPTFIDGTERVLEGDTIIVAIGQHSDLSPFKGDDGVEVTRWGTIVADPVTLETSSSGVFAGGDAVSGPASAVEAIEAGHKAAISIDRYLKGADLREGREKGDTVAARCPDTEGVIRQRRKIAEKLPIALRVKGFQEIEGCFTEEMALSEAARCLNCGVCSECLQCVKACGRNAIDHSMKEEEIELEVGAVIVALGFEKFDPRLKPEYGYKRLSNVLSSIEFERVLSASGPSQGHVVRPTDHKTPRKIAWLQCVGSRDVRLNEYCSSVCCMYATKEAMIAKEHAKGVDCHIYFMDMRSFGKDFEKYYERAEIEYGVKYRRSRVSAVEEVSGNGRLRLSFEAEDGKLGHDEYDMVVLSSGLVPPKGLKGLAGSLGIELNRYGFIKTDPFFPTETSKGGIFVCGGSSEPKDIPEAVSEASAAAARALALLAPARGSLVRPKVYPDEVNVAGQEPRIGVFICHCGINIGGVVDVTSVVEYAMGLPNVIHAEANLYTCSQDTQQRIKEKISEHGLNRVIVASCSPRTHEPLFQDTVREAGLNPYLFEMANIRDQCSWVHRDVPCEATEKAKDLVAMAVAKARYLQPIRRASIPLVKRALVVGGGLSGMVASLSLAEQGFEVCLVEREPELGGNLRRIFYTLEGVDPQELLGKIVKRVTSHPLIQVYLNSEIREVTGYVGNYRTTVRRREQRAETRDKMRDTPDFNQGSITCEAPNPPLQWGEYTINHGIAIIATGAREYRPTEYLYGEDPRVITQHELEELLSRPQTPDSRPQTQVSSLQTVVMIQCVGSRDRERPYCSRICCSHAIKNAIKLKEFNPRIDVFVLYRDIRTYGFKERFYRKARELGVIFIRYEPEEKPVVWAENGSLHVVIKESLLQERLLISPDLLVLSAGIVPDEQTELARHFKLPFSGDGFFLEAHAKLRPLDFSGDGLFLCGLAHSPRFIREAIAQAEGVGARAATLLSRDRIEAKGIVASVNERWCRGCGVCVLVCPYEARRINDEKCVAEVIDVLCQGCGACASACPNGATEQRAFEKGQILSMVETLL